MRRFFFSVLIASLFICAQATRYKHNTGKLQLRVDDCYPAGFVELNYISGSDTTDVLWLSFLGITFSGWDAPLYGRAADEGELYTATLYPWDTLALVEHISVDTTIQTDTIISDGDTTYVDTMLIDTSYVGSESYLAFEHSGSGLHFYQTVVADSGNRYITVQWILENASAGDLNSGRMVLHMDIDFPPPYFEDDYTIPSSEHIAACQIASGSDSACAGFVWLCGGIEYEIENTLKWYDYGTADSAMDELIYGNYWQMLGYCDSLDSGDVCAAFYDTSLAGDWGIGALISIPDLSVGDAETLRFAYIAAPNPDTFFQIVEEIDSLGIDLHSFSIRPEQVISISPNPFNMSCEIVAAGAESADLIDLCGRVVASLPLHRGRAVWTPANNIPSGIILVRVKTPMGIFKKKMLFLK